MKTSVAFVPILVINSGVTALSFYEKAFNAVEVKRWNNDDGTIHVAEFTIGGARFRLHEQAAHNRTFSPDMPGGVTAIIGLAVDDPYLIVQQAVKAGARVISPVQDYDYGYRQGTIADPFGHQWLIEKRIG